MKHRRGFLRRISLCLTLVGLLTGCGEETRGETLALEIQKEWQSMTGCAGQVKLEGEYADKHFECVLDVAYQRSSGGTLTFVEPELVEGITLGMSEKGLTLGYGDVLLDAGPVTGEGISPVESLWLLYELVDEGFLSAVEVDADSVTATFRRDDNPAGTGVEGTVCFSAATHAPLTAELYEDGARVIALQFRDFSRTEDEE